MSKNYLATAILKNCAAFYFSVRSVLLLLSQLLFITVFFIVKKGWNSVIPEE
jgi:hypothetical protein